MVINALEIERLVIATALISGGILTIYCPCGEATSGKGLLSCHIVEISTMIGIASLTILYANR
jgi:hypothetical protein